MLRSRCVAKLTPVVLFAACSIVLGQSREQAPAKEKLGGVISGVVFIDDNRAAGVTVKLFSQPPKDQAAAAEVSTDSDGVYRFSDVPPGTYAVSPYRPDLFPVNATGFGFTRPIVITNGEEVERLDLRLAHGGVISGRVLGPVGQMAGGLRVWLDRLDKDGRSEACLRCVKEEGGPPLTDRSGAYSFLALPGRYKLRFAPWRGPGDGKVYQSVFCPGVADEQGAATVVVEPGDQVAVPDTRLLPPIETHEVTGKVVDADTGEPVPNLNWTLSRDFRDERKLYGIPYSGSADSNGEFVVRSLPSGRYNLHPQLTLGKNDYYGDTGNFEVSDQNVTVIVVKVHKTMTLSGSVRFENAIDAPPPFKLTDLHVVAQQNGGYAVAGPVAPDGAFTVTGVTPGQLKLDLQPFYVKGISFDPRTRNPKGAILLRVEFNGAAVPDRRLEISPGQDLTGLRIVVGYGRTTLNGEVKVEGGPFPQGAILVVDAEALPSNDFVRRSYVDAQGRFEIEGLVDGDYNLIVMCNGDCAKFFGSRVGCANGCAPLRTQHVTISDGKAEFTTIPIDLNSLR
ncbi:MAG TPA: carboxypeptidase regulatory-like domain-containing protein [Blastocatellia bacterium]|nr:carboxypeptidase regulatory-like domain-containing protein [Blastocatellia bacterium]